ncbi:MAG: hypothetical protein PW788_12625 [Micavibrio sp.]|nr:hypothetical protein [Micavibrio sp.]
MLERKIDLFKAKQNRLFSCDNAGFLLRRGSFSGKFHARISGMKKAG